MKRIYLSLIALLAVGSIQAQQRIQPSQIAVGNDAVTISAKETPKEVQELGSDKTAPARPASMERRDITYSFVRIGNTRYDLQSNASIGKRVLLHADGTVSAVWTTSTDNNFLNRGTGYNHFNGSNWFTAPAGATPRIENSRTGWPSIGLLNGGIEFTMGHDATAGGFILSKNASKGNQTFPTQTSVLTQNNTRPIWGRAASDGDRYIHFICNYADSSQPSEPRAPTINGVRAPMTYSRSSDGGLTWDIQHITLPGYDSTRWITGSADNYAIDVKDSIVAIVTGRLGTDVMLWKSTDNGSTFSPIFVDSFPYAPFDGTVLALDTPTCNDGTMDVIIDHDGKCHVWFGLSRVLDTDEFDESYSFYPSSAGLAYWNEDFTVANVIAIGSMMDRDQDGAYTILPGTWSALTSGNIPTNVLSVARLGNSSLIRQPSGGIDAQGRLFVTFSAPVEGDIDPNNLNYRDIFIMHSTDGGATWEGPQNLTQRLQKEDDFASIARDVNGFVHLIFQQDDIPGTNLQNNSTSASNHLIPDNGNDILYAAIPVQEILDKNIGNLRGLNVKEINKGASVFVVSQNQPNPFSDFTDITIYLNDFTPSLQLEIRDITGKKVLANTLNNMNPGNHILTVDGSTFSKGVYFYTITAGKNTVTNKMIVH